MSAENVYSLLPIFPFFLLYFRRFFSSSSCPIYNSHFRRFSSLPHLFICYYSSFVFLPFILFVWTGFFFPFFFFLLMLVRYTYILIVLRCVHPFIFLIWIILAGRLLSLSFLYILAKTVLWFFSDFLLTSLSHQHVFRVRLSLWSLLKCSLPGPLLNISSSISKQRNVLSFFLRDKETWEKKKYYVCWTVRWISWISYKFHSLMSIFLIDLSTFQNPVVYILQF